MKRGQISLMIAVAIVLIILFSLLFMFYSRTRGIQVDNDNLAQIRKPVEMYIDGCLYKVLDNGLDLLGKQGGVIFESQGGKTPDNLKNMRRMYLFHGTYIFAPIDMRMNGDMTCQPYIPEYYKPERCPSVAYPFKGTNSGVIDYDEKAELPQTFRIMNRLFYHGIFSRDEEIYYNQDWKKSARNIYYNLKSYMENNIKQCLELNELSKKGILVKAEGNLSIIPVFSERGTSALMFYPVSITDGKNTVKLTKFYAEDQKRLFSIYKYLYSVLKKKASDFIYNLSQHQPSDFGYDYLFMNISKDVSGKDDLLTVFQRINGNIIYSYRQIIYNSPPAMSYIHYKNLSVIPGLIDMINDCPFYKSSGENPWEFKSHLSAGIGTEISARSIACIYYAYNKLVKGYRPYVDPDGDNCTMSFKVGSCNWNQPCELKDENLADYPKVPLIIRFSDGEYYDYENMTIDLIDHKPKIVGFTKPCRTMNTPDVSYKVCTLLAIDVDLRHDVDSLTLKSVSPRPLQIENKRTEGAKTYWDIVFRTPLNRAYFTVIDSYGKSDTGAFDVT